MNQTARQQSELENFRMQKDAIFKSDPDSPLSREQKLVFEGLRYFPENPLLRMDLKLERLNPVETIEMQTSTGDTQKYERYGRIHFQVDGQNAELTVYKNRYGLFLPFVDSLANHETYGAGRYLEPELLSADTLRVDFNLAYNPYCAYNENWSCPLTPFENRLKVPVRAGEKLFNEPSDTPG